MTALNWRMPFAPHNQSPSTVNFGARGLVRNRGVDVQRTERGDIVETDSLLLFWSGWPSQWYPCQFKIDGVEYNCTEQFMMAQKAVLFDDADTLKLIMASTSPREQKKLGRQVKNFDETKWREVAETVVYRGNFARFSQNPYFTKLLRKTGTKTIAEASPYDPIWGIGLAPSDPLALDPSNWKGENLLGKVLMRVRSTLNH